MAKRRSLHVVSLLGLSLLVFVAACNNNGGPNASSTPTSAPQAALVGTWTGCMFLEFHGVTFHADGTADLDNYVIHYTFDGTRIEFSSLPQDYINTTTEFSTLLSSDHDLLTLTGAQGNSCVMARSGSSGERKFLSSIVGIWIGNCNVNDNQYTLEFHRITFLADGTFTSDTTYTFVFNNGSPNGTYVIPQTYSDDSTLGLAWGDGSPELFYWEISADGKTLTLSDPGRSSCLLTRSS